MYWIIDVSYIEEYKLKLKFNNNEYKIVDLKSHLEGKIFEPLKNISYFKSVKLNKDIDTIVWPNNADFSPDFFMKSDRKINFLKELYRTLKRKIFLFRLKEAEENLRQP